MIIKAKKIRENSLTEIWMLKRWVLTKDLNWLIDAAFLIVAGRLFQSLGATIENALSP